MAAHTTPRSFNLTFVFCVLAIAFTLLPETARADLRARGRDRQHREWRRQHELEHLQSERDQQQQQSPIATLTTSLPDQEHTAVAHLDRRATTATTTSHTGVWTSSDSTRTILVSTASSTNRCEPVFVAVCKPRVSPPSSHFALYHPIFLSSSHVPVHNLARDRGA